MGEQEDKILSEAGMESQEINGETETTEKETSVKNEPERESVKTDNTGEKLKQKLDALKNGQDVQSLADVVNSVMAELGIGQNVTANIVIANEIKKSSFFKNGDQDEGTEADPGASDRGYNLEDEDELKRFVAEKRNSMLLLYMLVFSSLRAVEKSRLYGLAQRLRRHLTKDKEMYAEDSQCPMYYILKQINAAEYTIVKNTAAGRLELDGAGYSEELSGRLKRLIWNELVYLRKPLLDWLMELNRTEAYPVDYLAAEGIAEYAAMDFSYAFDSIIKPLTHADKTSGIGTLSRVLTALYKDQRYKDNIVTLTGHWLNVNGSKSWLAALSMYLKFPESAEERRVKDKLKRVITEEEDSMEDEVFKYLGILIHGYKDLAPMVYGVAAEAFVSGDNQAKEIISLSLLNLLLYEVMMSKSEHGRLNLIDAVNDKGCRNQIACIYRYIWSSWMLRHMLEAILDVHIEGMETSETGGYLRYFFRMLAFSGKSRDFDNMIVYLDKGEQKQIQKRELRAWLCAILSERKQQGHRKIQKKEN